MRPTPALHATVTLSLDPLGVDAERRTGREAQSQMLGTGVLTGAMVGAGLALLFAPKAGAELRGDLNDSLTSVRDAVARRYQALAEMAGVELDNLEERVDRATESIEASARDVLQSATTRSRT